MEKEMRSAKRHPSGILSLPGVPIFIAIGLCIYERMKLGELFTSLVLTFSLHVAY
ncbi:MAG: hypothetical protein J6J86_10330 [Lachnospiraceae bacterium]|nr:hypothetical protein [Lachnospiraceae bacterium]